MTIYHNGTTTMVKCYRTGLVTVDDIRPENGIDQDGMKYDTIQENNDSGRTS